MEGRRGYSGGLFLFTSGEGRRDHAHGAFRGSLHSYFSLKNNKVFFCSADRHERENCRLPPWISVSDFTRCTWLSRSFSSRNYNSCRKFKPKLAASPAA